MTTHPEVVTRYGGRRHLGRAIPYAVFDPRHYTLCLGTSSWTIEEWERNPDHPSLTPEQMKVLPLCESCQKIAAIPEPTIEFRMTFGQKYRREAHGTLGLMPELPDGWATVTAVDEIAARNHIAGLIGPEYAFLYEPGEAGYPQTDVYPKGHLGSLDSLVNLARQIAEAEVPDTEHSFGVQVSIGPDGWLDLHLEDLTLEMTRAGVHEDTIARFEAALGRDDVVPSIVLVDRIIASGTRCDQCGAPGWCQHR